MSLRCRNDEPGANLCTDLKLAVRLPHSVLSVRDDELCKQRIVR